MVGNPTHYPGLQKYPGQVLEIVDILLDQDKGAVLRVGRHASGKPDDHAAAAALGRRVGQAATGGANEFFVSPGCGPGSD